MRPKKILVFERLFLRGVYIYYKSFFLVYKARSENLTHRCVRCWYLVWKTTSYQSTWSRSVSLLPPGTELQMSPLIRGLGARLRDLGTNWSCVIVPREMWIRPRLLTWRKLFRLVHFFYELNFIKAKNARKLQSNHPSLRIFDRSCRLHLFFIRFIRKNSENYPDILTDSYWYWYKPPIFLPRKCHKKYVPVLSYRSKRGWALPWFWWRSLNLTESQPSDSKKLDLHWCTSKPENLKTLINKIGLITPGDSVHIPIQRSGPSAQHQVHRFQIRSRVLASCVPLYTCCARWWCLHADRC